MENGSLGNTFTKHISCILEKVSLSGGDAADEFFLFLFHFHGIEKK